MQPIDSSAAVELTSLHKERVALREQYVTAYKSVMRKCMALANGKSQEQPTADELLQWNELSVRVSEHDARIRSLVGAVFVAHGQDARAPFAARSAQADPTLVG